MGICCAQRIEAQKGGQPAQDRTIGDGGAEISVQDFISVSVLLSTLL